MSKPGPKCRACQWQRWVDALDIDGIAKAVLRVLIRYANYQTRECFPALPTIAGVSRFHKSCVIEALKRLEDTYRVITIAYSKGGRGCPSIYTLNCPPGVPFRPGKTVRDKDGLDNETVVLANKTVVLGVQNSPPERHHLSKEPINEPRADARNSKDSFLKNSADVKKSAVPNWKRPEGWVGTATKETAMENIALARAAIGRRRGHPPAATQPAKPPKRKRRGNGAADE